MRMPDKGDPLEVFDDDKCIVVLNAISKGQKGGTKWVGRDSIYKRVLPKRTRLTREKVVMKPDTLKVYSSLRAPKGLERKTPTATTKDYLRVTGTLPHRKQVTRALEKLESSGFIEKRQRKGKHEYRFTEEGAYLYLKTELADRILECADFILRSPGGNLLVWSDEIISYSSTPIWLDWSNIPDFERDVKEKLEEATKNFKTLWQRGYELLREKKNTSSEEEPRVVIVLDFNPMTG